MQENWHNLTLAEQLGNAGSDYERALRWKAKGNKKMLDGALARLLKQLDSTLSDQRWAGPRRRELARLRDEVCTEIIYRNNPKSAARLQKYFFVQALQARKSK